MGDNAGEGHYTGYVDERGEQRWVPRIAIEKTNQLWRSNWGMNTWADATSASTRRRCAWRLPTRTDSKSA